MRIRYEWRKLSEDGLLKEPRDVGPHYDTFNVNCFGGFESEGSALARLEELFSTDKYNCDDLVLIKIFTKT